MTNNKTQNNSNYIQTYPRSRHWFAFPSFTTHERLSEASSGITHKHYLLQWSEREKVLYSVHATLADKPLPFFILQVNIIGRPTSKASVFFALQLTLHRTDICRERLSIVNARLMRAVHIRQVRLDRPYFIVHPLWMHDHHLATRISRWQRECARSNYVPRLMLVLAP